MFPRAIIVILLAFCTEPYYHDRLNRAMYIGEMRNLRHELYGESVFTSFRTFEASVLGLNKHFERLYNSVTLCYGLRHIDPKTFNEYFLERLSLASQFQKYPNHYFRISIFSNGDKSLSKKNFGLGELEVDLKISKLPEKKASLKLKTFQSPYSEHYIPLKTGSYFQSLYFKRLAMSKGHDDVLFMRDDLILETSTSNLVLFKNAQAFFPEAKGILAGVTTSLLQKYFQSVNVSYTQMPIQYASLQDFDEVFALNAVRGLTPVLKIDDNEFVVNGQKELEKKFVEFAKDDL